MAYDAWAQPDVLNASGRSRPRWVDRSGTTAGPDLGYSALDMSAIPISDDIAPSAIYSQIDRQMQGIQSTKRRSKSGTYNVRALDAIVGLAASGYFNPKFRKRKIAPPMTTALGFVNVPYCAPTKSKRKRYY